MLLSLYTLIDFAALSCSNTVLYEVWSFFQQGDESHASQEELPFTKWNDIGDLLDPCWPHILAPLCVPLLRYIHKPYHTPVLSSK
jgi:hypothetical protein